MTRQITAGKSVRWKRWPACKRNRGPPARDPMAPGPVTRRPRAPSRQIEGSKCFTFRRPSRGNPPVLSLRAQQTRLTRRVRAARVKRSGLVSAVLPFWSPKFRPPGNSAHPIPQWPPGEARRRPARRGRGNSLSDAGFPKGCPSARRWGKTPNRPRRSPPTPASACSAANRGSFCRRVRSRRVWPPAVDRGSRS